MSTEVAAAGEQCKIVYIPDKPPVDPHLQPTVDVLAAVIGAQHGNAIVRKLGPLENFRHVKRVRKKCCDGGKSELSVILCLASKDESQSESIPKHVLKIIEQYQLSTFVAKVCKYAASSKEEWDEQCKFWPTSYHPPTFSIAGITGFNEEETRTVFGFMKYAVDLAKLRSNLVVNAAVIVDPFTKQVISSARDHDLSGNTVDSNTNIKNNCSNSVSCLHPWRWAEQQLFTSSESWHPLRHAAMVAIEHSASRDRLLFPNNGHIGAEISVEECMIFASTDVPSKRQKNNLPNVEDAEKLQLNTSRSGSKQSYLCTGFDIYLVWEPCIMCAMALLHQRIRRIFYALPNGNAGALGSVHRLQGEKSLNHHYAVFRVLLPEELLTGHTKITGTSNS